MLNKKSLFTKLAAVSMVASMITASGKKSIAELWAIQSDSNDQYFYRVC